MKFVTSVLPVFILASLAFVAAGCGGGSSSPPPPPPNPTPAITTLSPNSATAGGPAFTLTVNGSGFVSTSVASWNGSNLTTTFVSSTQLTASVPASDIATAGTAPVQVTNPTPGGGSSSTATFTINNPVPAVSSLSPASVVVGGAAFTLTLNGSNFVSGSTVQWNGSNRPTAFVSGNQVTAQIPATDIAAGGKAAISVSNPTPGGGASNSLVFNILFLPRFAYVASTNGVSVLTVDATTGQILHDGYAVAGSGPFAVAVDPLGRFVYAANTFSSDVSMYTINAANGALTSLGTVAAGANPVSVTVDPSGKFAYVVNTSGNDVSMYTIDNSTGILTPTGIAAAAGNPSAITVDPTGKFAYVTNITSSSVSMYTINPTTGALTSTGTIATGTTPFSVAVDPSGSFLYVANRDSNNVFMYTINPTTGALASTGTIAAGIGPLSVAVDPSGRFAYVANWVSGDVSMFTISASTGALTSVGTVAAGGTGPSAGPSYVGVDPSGKFAYVANDHSEEVLAYSIDGSTGALSPLGTLRVGVNGAPSSIAMTKGNAPITRTPKFAYVASATSNDVSMYTINATTGALTSTGTIAAGTGTFSVATDPSGRFAYVTNSSSNNASAYTIDATTGALTQVSGSPFAAGSNPAGLTVDPSGRFVYITNFASNNVSGYVIDPGSGNLTQIVGSPYAAANEPVSVAVDPTGRFAYVANQGGTAGGVCNPSAFPCGINAYSIDPISGALTAIAGSPFPGGPEPSSVVVDASARFVYVANQTTNTTAEFSIDPITGALTSIGFTSSVMGAGTSVAVEPFGRFAYVTDGFNNNVGAYAIDSSSGMLSVIPGSPFPTGTDPFSVAVDLSGKFAYVANTLSGNVSMFTVDPNTGALTSVGTIAAGTHPGSVATTGNIQ